MNYSQALMAPIEIENDAKVTINGTDYYIIETMFASSWDLAAYVAYDVLSSFTLNFTDDFRFILHSNSTSISTVSFTGSKFIDALGVNTFTKTSTDITANYTPGYTWYPNFHSSDDNMFSDYNKLKSSRASDGKIYGVIEKTRARRDIQWNWDEVTNVFKETELTGTPPTQETRCFVGVLQHVQNQVLYYNFINVKGVYLIENLNLLKSLITSIGVTWDDGIINGLYTYCTFDSISEPKASGAGNKKYYDCDLTLYTAEAPTWR